MVENMNLSEKGHQINPRIFVFNSSYACLVDETLSGAKLFKSSAELLCHFVRENPPAAQRLLTCSVFCISSWLEPPPPPPRKYHLRTDRILRELPLVDDCALHPPLVEGAPEPREKKLCECRTYVTIVR